MSLERWDRGTSPTIPNKTQLRKYEHCTGAVGQIYLFARCPFDLSSEFECGHGRRVSWLFGSGLASETSPESRPLLWINGIMFVCDIHLGISLLEQVQQPVYSSALIFRIDHWSVNYHIAFKLSASTSHWVEWGPPRFHCLYVFVPALLQAMQQCMVRPAFQMSFSCFLPELDSGRSYQEWHRARVGFSRLRMQVQILMHIFLNRIVCTKMLHYHAEWMCHIILMFQHHNLNLARIHRVFNDSALHYCKHTNFWWLSTFHRPGRTVTVLVVERTRYVEGLLTQVCVCVC